MDKMHKCPHCGSEFTVHITAKQQVKKWQPGDDLVRRGKTITGDLFFDDGIERDHPPWESDPSALGA